MVTLNIQILSTLKGKENRWGWCKKKFNQLGKVLHRANTYWSQSVLSVCIKQPVLRWWRFIFLNKYFLNVKCTEFFKEYWKENLINILFKSFMKSIMLYINISFVYVT